MNQPPGQPPFGRAPPPQGYPQQQAHPQQGYPQQQQYPQQGYPQQQQYPQQQPYPQQAPPGFAPPGNPLPPQGGYGPPPAWGGAAPNGSWAADSATERGRNHALTAAFAPQGGWENISRARGAAIFGLGVLVAGINAYMIADEGRYYIQILFFTPMLLITGLYMLVVGTPQDPQTGAVAGWARLGYGISTIFGLLFGVIALVLVGC